MRLPYRFLIPALICLGAATSIGQQPIDDQQLFSNDKIHEVKIELAGQDWAELCKQSRNFFVFLGGVREESPYRYVKATIWVDGFKIENVGIRKKGLFGSQDDVRPSLKVKFSEYIDQKPIAGINRLTLNNNKQDTSQLSQTLTYELFRQAGVKAPRTSLTTVTVNGKHLGIYTNVESVKKPFLKSAFGSGKGNLYEGTVADFYPSALKFLEAKTNKKGKRSHVKELAELLKKEELDLERLEELVDLDYFFKYWVVEGLVRFWDGYSANQNNYFYYLDPKTDRGYFIPWGADSSFLENGGPFNNDPKLTSVYANGYLANRLFHHPGMAERYKREMQKALTEIWKEEELNDRIDELAAMLKGKLHSAQSGTAASIKQVKSFIKNRREIVDRELADWPPEVPEKPRKPMYGVKIGESSGQFETLWRKKRSRNPTKEGQAEIKLKMNDEEIEFKQIGATVQEFKFPTFGNRGLNPDPPVHLVLAGVRKKDDQRMTMSLYVDMDEFLAEPAGTFQVIGNISEGRGGSFSSIGNSTTRNLKGTVTFSRSSNRVGESVAGSFRVDVIQMRGGWFEK